MLPWVKSNEALNRPGGCPEALKEFATLEGETDLKFNISLVITDICDEILYSDNRMMDFYRYSLRELYAFCLPSGRAEIDNISDRAD